MAVERTRALAGRHRVVRKTQILRAQQRPYAHRIAGEFFAVLEMLELELIDIDDFAVDDAHRSISPNTISCVPMMVTTSAIMWPRDISSSAAK